MLKVLGSLMLLCGCTGIGLLQIKHMDKRVRTIRSMICALEVMERELSFRMPLLEEMLSATIQSTQAETRSFFSLCSNELSKNFSTPFYEIWSRAAYEHLKALKKSDFDHVLVLGSVLGRYDVEGQRQAINRTRTALEHGLSIAVAERSNYGKLYGVLGTTVGAFLVILLY